MASQSKSTPLSLEISTAFEGHLLDTLPPQKSSATASELLSLFTEMWRIRRMEMAADALYKAKLIRGFCHLGIGQVNREEKKKN